MTKQREKPEWVRVAEEYEGNGLRQREFAESRGMKLSTLQSWVYRRRRQESARKVIGSRAGAVVSRLAVRRQEFLTPLRH